MKCSHCGKENQPEATYCDNCGVPVHREQPESLQASYRSRISFIIGIFAGFLLVGVGLVLSLYAASFGMSGSEIFGYVLLVGGIVVLVVTIILFSRTR